jgi:hypothetical protein
MPNLGQLPLQQTLLALATVTTSSTSANISIPTASSYRLFVQVQTVSGTSPTLVVSFATSFDGGTTYNTILSTTTLNTSGQGDALMIRGYLAAGDVATRSPTAVLGTADLTAATVSNGPLNCANMKIRWVVGGTSPSFAFSVGIIAVAQDLSD